MLGCHVEFIRGGKVRVLYKLVVEITFNENQSFEDCISQYTNTFVKFKQFIEDAVREYN